TIVLKALRKSPRERYATANEFADDVERYLQGRPVLARPATFSYHLRKFVQRNWLATVVGMLAVLTLCAGIAATTWQARRALEQEHLAKAAQLGSERRFEEVRQLAHSILFDYHDGVKDLPGATPVRSRLVHDALDYLDRLAGEVGDDQTLQKELAAAYQR